jgi:hypothetical protein
LWEQEGDVPANEEDSYNWVAEGIPAGTGCECNLENKKYNFQVHSFPSSGWKIVS